MVSGHQRLKVLARRGVDEADVVVVDLDEAQEKLLNVTMNNPAIQGEWDESISDLLESLKEVSLKDGEFGGLRLNVLLEDLGPATRNINFGEVPGKSRLDVVDDITCPKCGHVFKK